MSWDAIAWAEAQPMPFASAQVRARAKAVLKCFAGYADVRGRSWVAMTVLIVATELGAKRTVQRGISDLKACGLMEETGDHEVFCGKLYPIYRLPVERGPQNMRERMRLERAAVGVTPVSPQDEIAELSGDTGDTPRDDTGDPLGVTPVSPNLDTETLTTFGHRTAPGARETAARLSGLEGLAPRSMLRFYDQPLALAALQMLAAEGLSAEVLGAALGRMSKHPDFRSRKHPPQLHDWLRRRGFIGWLDDDAPEDAGPSRTAEADAPAPPPGAAAEVDQAVWRTVVARLFDALPDSEFGSYLRPAFLGARDGRLFVVAGTGTGRDWISRRCWRRVEAWWAEADRAGRPLTLVSKIEFEAAASRMGVE